MIKRRGGAGAEYPVSEKICPGHPVPAADSTPASASGLPPVRLPFWFYTVLLFCALAVLFAVRRLAGITYFINDDIAMRDIVSGAYTGSPDTHMIFILRLIAVVLQGLFTWQPAVDWYALWMIGCHGLCLFVLLILAARWAASESAAEWTVKRTAGPAAACTFDRADGRRQAPPVRVWCAIPAAAAAFLALDAHALVMIQFTTVAAVLCWTAVAVLLAPCRVFRPLMRTVLAGALLLLSYNTRPNVCLLSLPFAAAAVWVQLSAGAAAGTDPDSDCPRLFSNTNRKGAAGAARYRLRPGAARPVLIAAAAVVALGVASGIFDAAQYRSEGWQRYLAFSRARALLYDYVEIPAYRSAGPAYRSAGLGETTVNLIRDYNLMSDPAITAEQLNQVRAVASAASPAGGEKAAAEMGDGGEQAVQILPERVHTAIRRVLALAEHERLKFYVFWNLLLLALALIVNRSASVPRTVLQNLFWPALGFAELLFLAWRGRMPERVAVVPLALSAAALLIACGHGLRKKAFVRQNFGAVRLTNGTGEAGGLPPDARRSVGSARLRIAAAAAMSLSLVLTAAFQTAGAREHHARYTRYHSRYREAVALVTQTDPNGVYFYNVGTMDFSFPQMAWRHTPFDGRFLTLGGWRSRSPLQIGNWARHGLDPAAGARAMLNDGVYFVASDASEAAHIRDYLNEQTGGVRAELVRVVDENGYYFECYRFCR